jgi:hypothetical protein
MKNTTVILFILIGSLLLPLKAICQAPLFKSSEPMLYSEAVPKFITKAQADSIIADYNKPSTFPTCFEHAGCNQIIIDGIKINDSLMAYYDGQYFTLRTDISKTRSVPTLTEYGYHFTRSDIREMADWKTLLDQKL